MIDFVYVWHVETDIGITFYLVGGDLEVKVLDFLSFMLKIFKTHIFQTL